jgi:indoleamine 2,3-dioxygenase
MISPQAKAWLTSYRVDPSHGFLPAQEPLKRLPRVFAAWENITQNLPWHLRSGMLDAQVARLSPFPLDELNSLAEWERAMQLLSFLSHAYLRQNGEDRKVLPAILAHPWVAVAEKLQRPPVIAHPAFVLYNWQKIDPQGPLLRKNIRTIQLLKGSASERGFILSTTAMEIIGARAWCCLAEMREAVQQQDAAVVEGKLYQLRRIVAEMQEAFGLMRDSCDPQVFYHEIRPFVGSFHDLHYEGVDDPVRSYDGGSAAQSAIFQSLDAALGVIPKDKNSRYFLLRMRSFMPRDHARFVADLEKEGLIPLFCQQSEALQEARAACIEAMLGFRNEHLKIVAQYIVGPAKGAEVVGTGGTSPMRFLKSVRDATKQSE